MRRIGSASQADVLRREWEKKPPQGRLIAQQIVPGCGAGVGVLVEANRLVAVAGHLRIRELPITGGTSCARITLHEPQMLEAAKKLIAQAGLISGICMVEFRFDASTGEFWALEFNPRYWGGLSTEIKSGADFPRLHVECVRRCTEQEVGVVRNIESRWLLGELRYFMEAVSSRRFRNLARMVRTTADHGLYVEDFGRGRFKPFLQQLRSTYQSYRTFGNFGFESPAKRLFFDALMQKSNSNNLSTLVSNA